MMRKSPDTFIVPGNFASDEDDPVARENQPVRAVPGKLLKFCSLGVLYETTMNNTAQLTIISWQQDPLRRSAERLQADSPGIAHDSARSGRPAHGLYRHTNSR